MNASTPSRVDFDLLADLERGDMFNVTFAPQNKATSVAIDELLKLIDSRVVTTSDIGRLKNFILNHHRWPAGQRRTVRLCVKISSLASVWTEFQRVLSQSLESLEIVSRRRPLVNREDLSKVGSELVLRFRPHHAAASAFADLYMLGYFGLVNPKAAIAALQSAMDACERHELVVTLKQRVPTRVVLEGTYSRLEPHLEVLRAKRHD